MIDMKYEGFHTDSALPVKPGTKVRVPKGALLHSTHPQNDSWIENGKSRTVTVNHVLNGTSMVVYELLYQRKRYGDDEPMLRGVDWDEVNRLMESNGGNHMYPVKNPQVVWAGSGGYWVSADINDVEIVNV